MSALEHLAAPAAAPVAPEDQQKRGITGYLLMLPGSIWLLLFFIVPTVTLLGSSLYDQSGSLLAGYEQTFSFSNYVDATHWLRRSPASCWASRSRTRSPSRPASGAT